MAVTRGTFLTTLGPKSIEANDDFPNELVKVIGVRH